MKKRMISSLLATLTITQLVSANMLTQEKIETLNKLIIQTENSGFDVTREKMAVTTAQLFLEFAKWDEDNVPVNKKYYEASPFKDDADNLSKNLANFQKNSINTVLDSAITEIKRVRSEEITRKPVPNIDYSKAYIVDGKFKIDDQYVFLSSYTFKPSINTNVDKYFGDLQGNYLSPSQLNEDDFSGKQWKINDLKNQTSQNIGDTFIDHNSIPSWVFDKYDNFDVGKRHFNSFDIDHPGAKEVYRGMIKAFVPLIKDKRSTDLGYMLFNEPSFPTQEGAWNSGVVSEYTKEKFRTWLATQHNNINDLNQLWNTTFDNFNNVLVTVPMNGNLRGEPIWYDWMRFNQVRVKSWFDFLITEIKKYDVDAKTHIKLMPWLWTGNTRDHGMDFEGLLELTDIIGFDAQSKYSRLWGTEPWMNDYSFDWQNPAMSFDFFSSIQPNQLLWDSENHFMHASAFSETDLDTDYLRSIYWLATTHGLSGASTWVWSRNADGSLTRKNEASSISDITHQPKALHAVTNTFLDMNAHSEDIVKLQDLVKPVRLFYSETSAINQKNYMDAIRDQYNALYFEGIALGFSTKNIIKNHTNKGIMIIVRNAQYVALSEIQALQSYIDNGGYVLIDTKSLTKDEYGRFHTIKLVNKEQRLVSYSSEQDMLSKMLSLAEQVDILSPLTLIENNKGKNIAWRVAQKSTDKYIISLINTGKQSVDFTLGQQQDNAMITTKDLFTNMSMENSLSLAPRKMLFLEVDLIAGAVSTPPEIPAPEVPKPKEEPTPTSENDSSGGSLGFEAFLLIMLITFRVSRKTQ